MKDYTTDLLRNIALIGHQSAGKTSLAESLLFATGATTRLGKIEEGNTVADFDEDEQARGLSIYSALLAVEYGGHKINVLDAPGYVDFMGEAKNAVRVADTAVVVVDAVSGPEVGTELAFDYAEEFRLPIAVVVNKMDRENANFANVLSVMGERFPNYRFVPVMLPIGAQAEFAGVVNLLTQQAHLGAGKEVAAPPADMADAIEEARLALIEAAAESDDALMEKYFEAETLTDDEIGAGLRAALGGSKHSLVPVFVTSATHNIGALPLLDALIAYAPAPSQRPVELLTEEGVEVLPGPHSDQGPTVAYVFHSHTDKYGTLSYFRLFSGTIKGNDALQNVTRGHEERMGSLMTMRGSTQIPLEAIHAGDIAVVAKLRETYTGHTLASKGFGKQVAPPHFPMPIYAVALHPRTQSDSAKMNEVLNTMTNADPTLKWRFDGAIKQAVLEGMGGTHLDVAIKRAERMGVGLDTSVPKVPYQETVTRSATSVYRHKKQTGGAGQFGEVHLRIEPLEEADFEFVNDVFGGAISNSYMPAIEKGIRALMKEGILAGFPISNVKVSVFDGKEHPVDSKPIAFEIAGREAFKLAFHDAGPVLFEPIMLVQINVPEANMGDIMGDLNTRRARIQGMNSEHGISTVTAQVPLSEMLRYTTQLRSMTSGRGYFTMQFDHYEVLPAHLAQEVIAARQKEKKEE